MANGDQAAAQDAVRPFGQRRKSVRGEDLGIGSGFVSERYLNRDGTFNIDKRGLPLLRQLSIYQMLITMSWSQFVAVAIAGYVGLTALFAAAYIAAGPGAIAGSQASAGYRQFLDAFFLSVQTLSTIGYGGLSPGTVAANLIATSEAIVGMFVVAMTTGLAFARFSRPRARLTFSRSAVIAPFRGGRALMLRVANRSRSLLTRVEGAVVMVVRQTGAHAPMRRAVTLSLERDSIMFLPLHWVLVHPIDENSPMHGMSETEFRNMNAEFMVLLSGLDETHGQPVNVRVSYLPVEVEWGAKFASMYLERDEGDPVTVDLGRIHDIEPAELPEIA